MEALSGAASGIAVVSLAIQLIQSVALIREFIKDVKGASKELHRLVGKLELLNALLENVQKVLEQQSSLSGTHFPAPSMAIFNCLQGCEDSIQPLVNIVKKLSLPQSQSGSSTARLKSEIKLGLKTKEIATLETRIQHDIDLLTNSLSINQSGILLGVYRRKVTRYQDQRIQDLKGNVKTYTRDILSTAEEISALLAFSGFGLTFTQQYPYGGIFPSLKTYPVGRLSGEMREIIRCGSVQQFQEEVSSGAVHPFMREVNGCYIAGARFLDWLVSLGLDPELCVASELADSVKISGHFDKRIVFERNWEHKWVLGFEWVFDHEAPGYLLFSEYTVIVVETISYHNEWPFCEWVHETERKRDDRSAHFSRRMAAKERKERARLGQKQPRSRMPGAWKW
ncbi:unnamed protein product [Alternaria alternata]